jgi:hypothetical protein
MCDAGRARLDDITGLPMGLPVLTETRLNMSGYIAL